MPGTTSEVGANVARIRDVIVEAAGRVGRDPIDVTIVAAAKGVGAARISEAVEAGVAAVGHNYVTELTDSRHALDTTAIRWHYIGALRSGTAHRVADLADVVETVSGERAARRLAGRAERAGKVLEVLLEVDFTGERIGLAPGDVALAARIVDQLTGLRLRGLMTVPPLTPRAEGARPWFARLRELRVDLARTYPDVLELSMGMSLDYGIAVQEGATMVRIGSAVFGARMP